MKSMVAEKFSDILSADTLGAAFQAQSELFERFISMAKSPDESEVIKTMLNKTIDISIALTGADHGSLILLDSDGGVADSILSHGDISPELKSVLVESAFKKGIAGWVWHHRKIGLVHDTENDDRWLTFPDQPYHTRSALALPIISGEVLLGILTLKHFAPNHFTPEIIELMRITAAQVAMVLENTCLFSNLNNSLRLGVIDARSSSEERFTKKRLLSLLSQPAAGALELTQKIATNLFAHMGKAPQEDDIPITNRLGTHPEKIKGAS